MFVSQRVLTLNIGHSKLVLAEFAVKVGQTPELQRYGTAPLPPEAEGEMLGSAIELALQAAMSQSGIRPGPVLLALPGQSVFTRFSKLPMVAKDKLGALIKGEAEQGVPFPLDEVVWDSVLLGADEAGLEHHVMIVAVKEEAVETLSAAVIRAGFDLEVVDTAPLALYNAMRYNYPEQDGCSLIVDIGARSTNLIFAEDEKVFTRAIPIAGNVITQEISKSFHISIPEAEELKCKHAFISLGGVYEVEDESLERMSKLVRNVMTRLHAEISRSINFYRSQQGGNAPVRIFLTGGSAVMPHMDAFFAEKFQTEVVFLNPFVNTRLANSLDVAAVEQDAFVLSETVGLALRRALKCPAEINLLPAEVIRQRTMRGRIPYFFASAVVLMMCLGVWALFEQKSADKYQTQQAETQRVLDGLKAKDTAVKAALKKRDDNLTKASLIAQLIEDRQAWMRTTKSLRNSLFEGVWLTSVSGIVDPASGRVTGVQITGQAWGDRMRLEEATAEKQGGPKMTAVELLCERLRKDPTFGSEGADVRIVSQHDSQAWLREFTIDVTLTPYSVAAKGQQAQKPGAQAK